MTNLATVENQGSALTQWSNPQIELIKQQIAPKCSDLELELFAQVCKRTGLDPFARQIYAIQRFTKDGPKMSIQTSVDGFRLIADRTGKYAGSETFWCGRDGQWVDVWLHDEPPAAAKTLVYKAGSDKAFVGVAKFASYAQLTKSGNLTQMWQKMSDLMIGKCSECLALRKAFPAELSGLYSREEMMQADNDGPMAKPPSPMRERFKLIMERTGHQSGQIKSMAQGLGMPPSADALSDEQAINLRNALYADWGMGQGVFSAPQHAANALLKLISQQLNGAQDDGVVWDAWEADVALRIEAKAEEMKQVEVVA